MLWSLAFVKFLQGKSVYKSALKKVAFLFVCVDVYVFFVIACAEIWYRG